MNLEIEKNILDKFWREIKVFFYEAWCEWTKINITEDFKKDWLSFFELSWKKIFYEKKDENNLDWWKILQKTEDKNQSKHSQNDKYLFISPKIKWRCGCATSFSFEKKLIDKDKLNKLKNAFKK